MLLLNYGYLRILECQKPPQHNMAEILPIRRKTLSKQSIECHNNHFCFTYELFRLITLVNHLISFAYLKMATIDIPLNFSVHEN